MSGRAVAVTVALAMALAGCGGDEPVASPFASAVEKRICPLLSTAKSIGFDEAELVGLVGTATVVTSAQAEQLILLISRHESYFGKLSRRMRRISAPPSLSRTWTDLVDTFAQIQRNARHVRYLSNERAAEAPTAAVRYLAQHSRLTSTVGLLRAKFREPAVRRCVVLPRDAA